MGIVPRTLGDRFAVSGLYVRRDLIADDFGLTAVVTDTVRLDVDGDFPQMRASGRFFPLPLSKVRPFEWITEKLEEVGANIWEGQIFNSYEGGQPTETYYVRARLEVKGLFVAGKELTLTLFPFSGAAPATRALDYESPWFRTAEFEVDTVRTAHKALSFDRGSHPDPSPEPRRPISVQSAYSQAGVDVRYSPNASVIDLESGPGGAIGPEGEIGKGAEIWDDQQLHDSMRGFWSRYKPGAQWAAWVLFAHRYREYLWDGKMTRTFGVMFDSGLDIATLGGKKVSPNDGIHRQGCAIFGDAIADDVATDQAPDAALRRSLFFAVMHETGHCFNLVHPDEDAAAGSWIPPPGQTLSFMNRPDRVTSFWQSFGYRFSPRELIFLRHAPESWVEMGNAVWGTGHGLSAGTLRLELAVGRPRLLYDFLEPVRLELRLVNAGPHPMIVDSQMLGDLHHLTVVTRRDEGRTRAWRPYVRHCRLSEPIVLEPGRSLATSALISTGVDGWQIAEPGVYRIAARLETARGAIAAEPIGIRVAMPASRDDESLAQDYFTDEVGRALALGGTHVMTGAIAALREVAERAPASAAARHAMVALALPLMRDTKILRVPEGEAPMASAACEKRRLETVPARPDEARDLLARALGEDGGCAAQTFGALEYERLGAIHSDWLAQCGYRAKRSRKIERKASARP